MTSTTPEPAREIVLLLHSGGMSSRQWRRLEELLSATYRVVAPDYLGSGANPPWPPDAPFHFRDDLAVLSALVAKLGEPVHVVGHSYGGFLALQLARLDPSKVRSLTVYDPVAFGVLHDAHDVEGLADLARAEKNPRISDEALRGSETWLEAFVDYWQGDGHWRTMPDAARDAFVRVGRKLSLEVHSLIDDRTGRADYACLGMPACIVVGERSPVAAQRLTALLASALPRGEIHRLDGAGHMGPITHGSAFNALVARHLAKASAGS